MPETGNDFDCQYCGKKVYTVDVFEKFRNLLGWNAFNHGFWDKTLPQTKPKVIFRHKRAIDTVKSLSMDYSVYEEMTASEKQVADYLKELQLWWHYESPVFLKDEKERPRVWTPDFYIPKLGMYVEVCGSESLREQYQYREKIYKKNSYIVIFLHLYKERERWKSFLLKRIVQLENSRHLEVMKILESRI